MSHLNGILLFLIVIAAVALRVPDLWRPINTDSWREADIGSISRNFATESFDPLCPRIDWRGETAGCTEMELPAYPFAIATTYKLFGIHEQIGRIWALLFSLGSLFFIILLAKRYLDTVGQIVAVAFFAFNPMIVEFSTAIQPEGLTLFLYLGAVYFFLRWIEDLGNRDFWLAAFFTASTILAKATAAHIGLLFAILLFQKFGWKLIKESRVWIFGLIALLPSIIWYTYAKSLWLTYGNSLGVSNEYHWVGLDLFTNPYFIKGILRSELTYVWVTAGILAGAYALIAGKRERIVQIAFFWFVSVYAMYFLAARTTADEWAIYYHIFGIPPAAILFGTGTSLMISSISGSIRDLRNLSITKKIVGIGVPLILLVTVSYTFVSETKGSRQLFENRIKVDPNYACAMDMKKDLSADGLILVSGAHCFDPDGYKTAFNASNMFYWLDRKGFNICIEDQSLENVATFATRGVRYFIARKSYLELRPGISESLKARYPVVFECDEHIVFDLNAINDPDLSSTSELNSRYLMNLAH